MNTQRRDTVFVGSSELAALMRDADWSQTAVGAVEGWPQCVRAILRMMLTSRYAMWMGWGPNLTFFYNDAYARMTLGAKHPWALGKPAREVWAEIWQDIGPRIEHVLETGDATWDEGLMLFLERSGFPEETYHTFSYSPLHEDDGTIVGMFCVVTEETERVIGERRLNLLRELGSQLTSSQSIDDVWRALERSLATDACDLPFTLTYVIDSEKLTLASSTNVRPDDPVATPELDVDDDTWPIQSQLNGSASQVLVNLPNTTVWPSGPWQKPPSKAIAIAIPQQGQSRPAGIFIAGLNPFRRVDAAYESFIGLFAGQLAAALANVQAYAAERHRAEALAQIDRAKTTFFSNVSHELRTPLTLMLGPVTDALTAETPTLTGEPLELVFRNGLRLRKLVNALLEFSRIEAGRVQANFEPVDLGAYTSELASTFESVTRRAGLIYSVETTSDGEPTYVDRDMWEKIVLNLISNAFKFTFEGEIKVSLERHGDRMVLRVSDTGTGIPADELPRIFDRFHRVEGAHGRTQEGTGIGLALVQELVRLHGGSVAVESSEGHGTTFTVTVPTGFAHLPADRISSSRPFDATAIAADVFVGEADRWLPDAADLSASTGARELVGQPIAGARIVLADDNADMRAYLGRLLSARWQVDVASDGEQAVELTRSVRPDLVVTDVMMPKLDGFGVLRALRADPDTRQIPVIMLSARAGEESRVEGFEAGADDYLVKPFTAREVMARVEAQLLRARVRSVEDEHRRRLTSVFSHAPVGVAILRGPAHIFELANAAYLELIDNRPVVGMPAREAIPEFEGQGIFELLDRVYESGERYIGRSFRGMVRRGPNREMTECFFDFVYQPTFDSDGQVDGIAVVVFEVTALVNARQTAEDASRAKDEFLAMLGHELRNPLAPILTALQLLRLRGVQAGDRERTIIERQVRHLVGLVDDLLDVSRITRGKIRLTRVPTQLSDVVARGIELASPLLEQHQQDLSVDVPTQGLTVFADPDRLAQVVSNLLTNAAKYTPPGGHIRVSAIVEDGDVVLRVRDTGIGIDPAMLPRVFDLFTQDRQAIDRAQGGLGLGLAIVRSLVALHEGSVSARSDGRGRGSEFIVRLPHLPVGAQASVESDQRTAAPVAPSGLRVLVVDDNEDAALMLVEALTHAGHQTLVAHDGPDALHVALQSRPDVALLDIGLPVMDGFELARQMRANPALTTTRLIAVTGYGQEHDRMRTRAAGFDAHLVKPVDLQRVSELITKFANDAHRDEARG